MTSLCCLRSVHRDVFVLLDDSHRLLSLVVRSDPLFVHNSPLTLLNNRVLQFPEVEYNWLVKYFHGVCWGIPLFFCLLLGEPIACVRTKSSELCFAIAGIIQSDSLMRYAIAA